MKSIALFFINIYMKFVSPLFPSRCRYYPSCSEYTFEAIKNFGFFKGGFLGAKRILRCNPFSKGGIDYVPQPKSKKGVKNA